MVFYIPDLYYIYQNFTDYTKYDLATKGLFINYKFCNKLENLPNGIEHITFDRSS